MPDLGRLFETLTTSRNMPSHGAHFSQFVCKLLPAQRDRAWGLRPKGTHYPRSARGLVPNST